MLTAPVGRAQKPGTRYKTSTGRRSGVSVRPRTLRLHKRGRQHPTNLRPEPTASPDGPHPGPNSPVGGIPVSKGVKSSSTSIASRSPSRLQRLLLRQTLTLHQRVRQLRIGTANLHAVNHIKSNAPPNPELLTMRRRKRTRLRQEIRIERQLPYTPQPALYGSSTVAPGPIPS